MRNVDQLVACGVFDTTGLSDMEVGRLNKHTEQLVRFSAAGMTAFNNADMYWKLAAHPETVKGTRSGKYVVVLPGGSFVDIAALAYRALTIPTEGE